MESARPQLLDVHRLNHCPDAFKRLRNTRVSVKTLDLVREEEDDSLHESQCQLDQLRVRTQSFSLLKTLLLLHQDSVSVALDQLKRLAEDTFDRFLSVNLDQRVEGLREKVGNNLEEQSQNLATKCAMLET